MIADRHIFIVGQERIVRSELASDVYRMMDADVEIRIVADCSRHVERTLDRASEVRSEPIAMRSIA